MHIERLAQITDPIITSAILGASRVDQLANTLAAVDLVLDAELKKELDELTEESIDAEMQAGKRRTRKMHNLVVSFLAVAYLAANVYAIVTVGVFEVARSRKHLILYGVPFILWGSLILLGCKLLEILRRFDEWAA